MLLNTIKDNFNLFRTKTAFCIEGEKYSYAYFQKKVAAIQVLLFEKGIKNNDVIVLETFNNIDTYASIFAIWFSGGTFVPINPKHPKDRINLILDQIEIDFVLSSEINNAKNYTGDIEFISTKGVKINESNIEITALNPNRVMYILFTSGSTGIPKGVSISLRNITAFIKNFSKAGYKLNEKDKFLQIYDLTFDASIHCYLFPLFIGASVYTVSTNRIKYLEALKIMSNYSITFAKFPPSVLAYLQPYFDRIKLPYLRYCLLGGESFNLHIAEKWMKCVPNAKVQNVYGPTEATINTHIFNLQLHNLKKKSYKGIITIGKPFGTNKAIVVDFENNAIGVNEKGELCLSGDQVTFGYLNKLEKNEEFFFIEEIENVKHSFYKTGDLVYIDDDGDFIFCGRIDNQVQINGYRVELLEIENLAFKFGKALNYVAISEKDKLGVTKILLFCENIEGETSSLYDYLSIKLPLYMLPESIINLQKFPLTSSGKIDRKEILKNYKKIKV